MLYPFLTSLQVRDPRYGHWLDTYFTVIAPLVQPVAGLLGKRRLRRWLRQ